MKSSLRRSCDTKNKINLRQSDTLPPIRQSRYSKMNLQQRKKLSQSLTQSLIDKFNDKTKKKLIEKEVNEFLKRESINEKNIKELENLISKKIRIKNTDKELQEKIIQNTKPKITIVTEEKKAEGINPNVAGGEKEKQDLNVSGMSGGSDLDKFDGRIPKEEIENQEMKELEQFKKSMDEPLVKKVQIDTSKYNDEWDAINMYNKRLYEERIKREKEKQREMKLRTRTDLLNQIQQKIKRKYEQELKDREYDEMIQKHLKKMGNDPKTSKKNGRIRQKAKRRKTKTSLERKRNKR